MTAATSPQTRVPLDLIDVGKNVRELDSAHVQALAGSIALRGLIVPLTVRRDGRRFRLVAGFHRHAACVKLGVAEVEVSIREQDDRDGADSADRAAENVLRIQLSPLEEARAVQAMLDRGYSIDGAAAVLGWARSRVTARTQILALPELAQRMLGDGRLPVGAVETLTKIAAVSRELCEAALEPVQSGQLDGGQLMRDPGWTLSLALRGKKQPFAAWLGVLTDHHIAELRLGKRASEAYEHARALHGKLEPHGYVSLRVDFAEAEIDQARAAGVLLELPGKQPLIVDRALYRELAKQAIARTLTELQARAVEHAQRNSAARKRRHADLTPEQQALAEHRAAVRQLAERAHNVNLDLGAQLRDGLDVVDPDEIEIARFFAYGLLGPSSQSLGPRESTARVLAVNGLRLVLPEHRTETTPTLKSGKPGKRKIAYADPQEATDWLWEFIGAAKTPRQLYGRTLIAFAAQHYATQLVLARSGRRPSAVPRSHEEASRKALEAIVRKHLPGTHVELQRAIRRLERGYAKTQEARAPKPNAAEQTATA